MAEGHELELRGSECMSDAANEFLGRVPATITEYGVEQFVFEAGDVVHRRVVGASPGESSASLVDAAISAPRKIRIDLLEGDRKKAEKEHQVLGTWEASSSLDLVVGVDVNVAEIASDVPLRVAAKATHPPPLVWIGNPPSSTSETTGAP